MSRGGSTNHVQCDLGGGFKYFLFSPLFGEDSHFDEYFSNGLKPPTSDAKNVSFFFKTTTATTAAATTLLLLLFLVLFILLLMIGYTITHHARS